MGWKRRAAKRLHDAARIQPGRPAIRAGLRSAVVTVVPLAAGWALVTPEFTWTAIAALFLSITDKGGAYWLRFKLSGVLALATSLAIVAGAVLGRSAWLAVAGMFLVGAGAGMCTALGDRGTAVGRMAAISFAVSLADPAVFPGEGVTRGAYALLGGVWAMGFSLSLWPLRFYQPARMSLALLYRSLASKAEELAAFLEEGASEARWSRHLAHFETRIRERSEEARASLVATRKGSMGHRRRGERLVALFEGAQRMAALLEGLSAILEPLGAGEETREIRVASISSLRRFSADMRNIARRALGSSEGNMAAGSYSIRASIPTSQGTEAAVGILFDRMGEYVGAAWLEGVELGETRHPLQRARDGSSLVQQLRDQLLPGSVVSRHALRLAVVSALSVAIARGFRLPMAQWVTVAVIGILQPYMSSTFRRGFQRVGGTVLGGVTAAVLVALFNQPLGIMFLIFVFAAVGVSLLPVNYGLYSILLTPTYVLLSELWGGDWHLAEVRIVNTLLGGILAFLGMRLFWPGSERERLAREIASGLQSSKRYLAEVSKGAPLPTIRACRGRAGAAATGAEASFQRVLDEGRIGSDKTGALLSLVTYLRRLDSSITSLSSVRRRHPFSVEITDSSCRVLDDLAESVAHQRGPKPLEIELKPRPGNPLAEVLEHRIARQIRVLHRAVSELVEGGMEGDSPRKTLPAS